MGGKPTLRIGTAYYRTFQLELVAKLLVYTGCLTYTTWPGSRYRTTLLEVKYVLQPPRP